MVEGEEGLAGLGRELERLGGCRKVSKKAQQVSSLVGGALGRAIVTPRFPKYVKTELRRRSATYMREENTHVYTLSLK